MPKQIFIRKASGDLVAFDPQKVIESLKRAHVKSNVINEIVREITPTVKNGMSTKELYHTIYDMLDTHDSVQAAKYNLKQAIMELGPSGYPFEQFIASVLRRFGYETWTNQTVKGRCITHEIDIIAERNQIHYMIEAKYHNIAGSKTGAQEALYTQARFEDLRHKWEKPDTNSAHELKRGWLITNTKLSGDAIAYANCVGLEVSSWDYPQGTSLRKLITTSGAHPITSLKSLTKDQLGYLIKKKYVVCLDLLELPQKEIDKMGLQQAKKEAQAVCTSPIEDFEAKQTTNPPKKFRQT